MKLSKITLSILGLLLLTGASTTNVLADATYTVIENDTLSKIAEDNGTTIQSLAKLNDLEDVNLILPGQVLKLDGTKKEDPKPAAKPAAQPAPVAKPVAAPVQRQAQPASPVVSANTSEAAAKEWIAQVESGGSYSARNGIYIGRYQLTNAYLHGDYSPANQERVANNYVMSRYGSWVGAKNFHLSHGWY
ncbi:LysM peptidoglycan-binding domain-containing protein [Lactobacillus sp. YT155]|uniref:aggregation-promoting factor n=1 Tax=Lactobacillus sp. YT155 TaxID=3060955 RepID=UPI00265FEBCD|nr:LysM peptidoglycan-binding domain-containing protein [Lactobacillus sp. YT155]MDO1605654.1 LysM peptidoglycan-binding domain-containing protein [Lactobacillus sp. YT155]